MEFDARLWIAAFAVLLLSAAIVVYTANPDSYSSQTKFQKIAGRENATKALEEKAAKFRRAPDWSSYEGVINNGGKGTLSAADLKGKAVLVDFWTYSCINCIRTLPYLKMWDEKYRGMGLVIVGVHTPEFDFEKDRGNVQAATDRFGLEYPVVLDSQRRIWGEFQNSYWPRKYLIDPDGFIRFDHIGEGGYDETENAIIALLAEEGKNASASPPQNLGVGAETPDFYGIRTPEIYFGSNFRRQPLGNADIGYGQSGVFTLPQGLSQNAAYLEGEWVDRGDYIELLSGSGAVAIDFNARELHMVAASENGSNATIVLDGKESAAADDAKSGSASVKESTLYRLVKADGYGTHMAKIRIEGKGFRAYSFTFG